MNNASAGNGPFPTGIIADDASSIESDMALASQMLLFAKVADCMSFTVAATQLNCSKSAVSKSVAALEEHLGVKVLVRSSRAMRLTEAGEAFLEHCKSMRESTLRARDAAIACQSAPIGRLRIAAPVTFGMLYVQPVVSRILLQYPGLQAELQLTDRSIDVRRDLVDMVIVISKQLPSDVVAREILRVRWVLCAAPAYLAAHGAPSNPKLLASHPMLFVGSDPPASIQMSKDEETIDLNLPCRMLSNNSVAVVRSAEAGVGIALLPTYAAARSLQAGRLVAVLPDWCGRESCVHAQYLAGRHIVPKVRVFIDALVDALKGLPPC